MIAHCENNPFGNVRLNERRTPVAVIGFHQASADVVEETRKNNLFRFPAAFGQGGALQEMGAGRKAKRKIVIKTRTIGQRTQPLYMRPFLIALEASPWLLGRKSLPEPRRHLRVSI